nr:VpsC protein [uncultured bacterium]
MERSTSENLRLGVFVILGSVLLVITAYLIGNRQNMFGSNFQLSSVFKNVNGLQEGNNVRFSGVNVGTVKNIEMINDTSIRVHMVISDAMLEHIRKDALASVGSDGLVGSMIINILPGKGNAGNVVSGDEIRSYSRVATEDMLNTLSESNENIALLTADLLKITDAMVSGEGTIGMLIHDTLIAQGLKRTMVNLQQASGRANTAIGDMKGMIQDMRSNESVAGVLLSDEVSAERMRNMIAGLERSSVDIGKITADLSVVMGEIKDGEGGLNYLATDKGFVSSLDSTMQNLQKGSVLLNEDLEALKHNFLFRGYFKKQEKEKKKAERDQ